MNIYLQSDSILFVSSFNVNLIPSYGAFFFYIYSIFNYIFSRTFRDIFKFQMIGTIGKFTYFFMYFAQYISATNYRLYIKPTNYRSPRNCWFEHFFGHLEISENWTVGEPVDPQEFVRYFILSTHLIYKKYFTTVKILINQQDNHFYTFNT